jgi:hypothetical protein
MEVCNFKGTIYGKLENQYFVWDSSWEIFRPIEKLGWNGKEITIVEKYKQDLFDPWYGFGSPEMKKLCERLTDITSLDVPESGIPWFTEWWKDRYCSFAYDCSPRTSASWLKYIKYTNSRAKTLRTHFKTRATKRLVPK